MTIRAHISDEYRFPGSIRIWIADLDDGEQPRRVLRHDGGDQYSWELVDDPTVEIMPTFSLTEGASRALADGLVRHFQGVEDTRRLRADYDAALRRADAKDQLIADVLRNITGGAR